jgi:hypothetical protein
MYRASPAGFTNSRLLAAFFFAAFFFAAIDLPFSWPDENAALAAALRLTQKVPAPPEARAGTEESRHGDHSRVTDAGLVFRAARFPSQNVCSKPNSSPVSAV